jgi:hypothetical protein
MKKVLTKLETQKNVKKNDEMKKLIGDCKEVQK